MKRLVFLLVGVIVATLAVLLLASDLDNTIRFGSYNPSITRTILAVIIAVAVPVGIVARQSKDQLKELSRSARRAREAERKLVTSEFRNALHDSALQELNRSLAIANVLASVKPADSSRLTDSLIEANSRAADQIRSLLRDHSKQDQDYTNQVASVPQAQGIYDTIERAIADSTRFLATKNVDLVASMSLDRARLRDDDQEALLLVREAVRECLSNIEKYCDRDETATLTVRLNDNQLTVDSQSPMPLRPMDLISSGGYGLTKLDGLLGEYGGELDYGVEGTNWIMAATVPLRGGRS